MVPLATMHEALQAVVMKPLQERLLAIHWTLDDIKELLNNQAVETQDLKKMLAEKEEKRAIYVYICYVCCYYDHTYDWMLLGYV